MNEVSGKIEVFSSGGGTQSAAISALIIQGRLPKPDFVLIVDTERERESTWRYLDDVIRPNLQSAGIEVHRIRKSIWGTFPNHGNDLLSHNAETLIIPAFTTQTEGQVGKLSGFCSKTWKVEVADRYLSIKYGITRAKFRKWIGFSLDETRRASRMMAGQEFQKGLIRLPLIHDVPLRRQEAINLVESMGWPPPPRSACWMCPNQGDEEWSLLPSDEFEKACKLDEAVREVDPFAYLHNSGQPLREVKFKTKTEDEDRACSSGECFL